MAVVTSDVEIANLALVGQLGRGPLTALSDADLEGGPDAAKIMRALYGPTRDELLAAHPWNFGITRVAPALLAEVPLYSFSLLYALPEGGTPAPGQPAPPPSCLRVLDTNLDPTWGYWWPWPVATLSPWPWPLSGVQGAWQVEGRKVATNSEGLEIRYMGQITDVTLYSPGFVAAFAAALAAKACWPLTRSDATTERFTKLAAIRLSEARVRDGQEGSQLQFISKTLTWEVR